MANTSISTAQNVNLNYNIVSIGERCLGYLIDLGVFIVYLSVLGITLNLMDNDFSRVFSEFGLYNLLLFPVFFYSLYMHILFEGRTIGKFIMKTKVVKEDGSPLHFSNYLVRWMMNLVDFWLFNFSVGIISVALSDKRQRLGDLAASSIVISTKQKTKITHTILEEIEEDYTPTFAQVMNLNDEDVRTIKDVMQVAIRHRDYATLIQLRQKVAQVMQVESDLHDRDFLQLVLKDYNYYTQGNYN